MGRSAVVLFAGKLRRLGGHLLQTGRPSVTSGESLATAPAPAAVPVAAPAAASVHVTAPVTARKDENVPGVIQQSSAPSRKTVASPEEPLRNFLPGALFIITFVTVITTLLIYMDNTAMKQQQFRQNMRREDELAKVAQDDDVLVAYIRQLQFSSAAKPFPPHSHHMAIHHEPSSVNPTLTENVVAQLLNLKRNGVFVEVGAYGAGAGGISRTEWLERALGWGGLLLTPDAHDYFRLRARRTAPNTLTIHACLSTSTHPKEITYQESWPREEVGVLALGNAGEEFSARVKCFPLYSLLLAAQMRNVDFLSLSCGGCELAALLSLPHDDKIHISIVEIVGKQTMGVESLLLSRGYNIATKTKSSTIYAVRDIPTVKI